MDLCTAGSVVAGKYPITHLKNDTHARGRQEHSLTQRSLKKATSRNLKVRSHIRHVTQLFNIATGPLLLSCPGKSSS